MNERCVSFFGEPSRASLGATSWRNETSSRRQESDVFPSISGLEPVDDCLLCLWRPVDPQVLPGPCDGSVEDVVRDVVLVGASDDDLDHVVLQSLGLVDSDRIRHLERDGGGVGVIVLITDFDVVDRESYRRIGNPLQVGVPLDVELGHWPVEPNVELNAAIGGLDVDDGALEVVVDQRFEPVGVREQDRVADLVDRRPPWDGGRGVAGLQEPVDVVDAIQAVVVQRQNNVVGRVVVEEAGIKGGRVPVAGDGLGDAFVEVADLVPEVDEVTTAGAVRRIQLEDGRRLDVGTHDVEPVAESDGLDLKDIPDEHDEFEAGVLQDVEEIGVTHRRALVDYEQVEVTSGVVLVAGDCFVG